MRAVVSKGIWMLLLVITGCQPALNRQPKVAKPDTTSAFFADGRSTRPLEPGTVALGSLNDDTTRFTGKEKNEFVKTFPLSITEKFVLRGRERFNIYCAMCHDRLGTGNGKVVQRGYIKPPSYQTDDSRGMALRGQNVKLTDVPVGYIFDVITNGYGAMPSHGEMIPPDDRWAIIAYVRALQVREQGGNGGK